MRKLTVVMAALLLVAIGAVAYASIPGPDGVIHGCYKINNPAQGAVIVIDHTASCPSGYTALNWNQTGPQGPAGPGASVVNVVKRYDTSTSGLSAGYGHHIETVSCPTGKHILNGGVSTWAPDESLPAGQYQGTAYDASSDSGWSIESGSALPRPVDENTGWRLTTWVSLPYDSSVNPAVFYPIDVTYFVVCA